MFVNEKLCVLWSLLFLYNSKVCSADECKPYEESEISKKALKGCEKRVIPHGSICYYRPHHDWEGKISCDEGYYLKDYGNPICVYDIFSTQWSWNTSSLYSTCELINTTRTPPTSTTCKDAIVPSSTATSVVTEYVSQHENSSSSAATDATTVSSTSVIRITSESDKEEVNPIVINICVAIATIVVTAIVVTAIYYARKLYQERQASTNISLRPKLLPVGSAPKQDLQDVPELETETNAEHMYVDIDDSHVDCRSTSTHQPEESQYTNVQPETCVRINAIHNDNVKSDINKDQQQDATTKANNASNTGIYSYATETENAYEEQQFHNNWASNNAKDIAHEEMDHVYDRTNTGSVNIRSAVDFDTYDHVSYGVDAEVSMCKI